MKKGLCQWYSGIPKVNEVLNRLLRYISLEPALRALTFLLLAFVFFAEFGFASATTPNPPTILTPNIETFENSTPEVDAPTGALTERITIDVPPGRNGMQPDLSLNYNSQDTAQDSEVGYGWSLSIPYIARLNKVGSENLYDSTPYFTSSIDGELATTTSTNLYHGRVDQTFDAYTYSTSTNSWTMYETNGTEYLFGDTSNSQESTTTSQTGTIETYKWMLEKEIDTNGNYARYVYTSNNNQIYPYQIIYTGHNSTDGPMTITFATTTRTDDTINMLPGFEVDTDWLISQINLAVSSTTVRQYNLSYTTGNNGYRSLLSSVQESGWNSSSIETTLPPWTFAYISSSTPFVSSATGSSNCSNSGSSDAVSEVLGDGVSRSVAVDYNGVSAQVYISNDASSPISWPNSGATFAYSGPSSWCPNETGTRLVDVSGNGKANVVQNSFDYVTGTSTSLYYYVNTGGSWSATSSYTGVIPQFYVSASGPGEAGTTGIFGDVDGTGLPTYEQDINISGYPDITNGAYLPNGFTWNTATTTIFSPPESFPSSGADCTDSQLVDLTGDGLDDWVYTNGANTYVLLNNGSGWESTPDPLWTISTSTIYASGGNCYDEGWRFVDVNGDGLPDLVRSYTNTGNTNMQPGTYQVVYINTGHGWATSTAYTLPYIVDAYNTAGNDVSDIELANFMGNGQQYQDVLATTTNPKGGSTSITYGYTTQLGGNSQLPYNLLVVTEIVNHDGRGSDEETDYSYQGGLQYLPSNVFDRKFAGFAVSTTTTSISTTVTYYSQGATSSAITWGDINDGYAQINHPYRTDVFSPSGTLVQRTVERWDSYPNGPTSNFLAVGQKILQSFAPNGAHRDTAIAYTYSTTTIASTTVATGNLIKQVNYGEVTASSTGTFATSSLSTPRTTLYSYVASSSVNMSLPSEITLFNDSNATTTDQKFFYDKLSFGQVSLGNQTEEEDWVSGTHYASSTKSYNSYGLVASSTDRDGNITTYSYDSLNLYPATTTNVLSQSTTYIYNYSNGKVATTTDPNRRVTVTSYDGIGRPTEIQQSDVTTPTTLDIKTTYQYTDSTSTPSLIEEIDYLNSATSTYTYDYYDGLDRLIQERKSTEYSATSSVMDNIYNTAGFLQSQSLPYFSAGTSLTATTTDPNLYTNYYYDPLGRVATTTNAVGTTVNTFNDWTTTVTDPLGHITDDIDDAYGNLAQVVEHLSSSNATTTYSYDAANNLTNITEALGNVRNFAYDGLGDRLSAQDLHATSSPSYGTWTYTFDDAGNNLTRTDPDGHLITDTYDALNRLLTESVSSTTGNQITNIYDSCTNGIGYLCSASSSAAFDAYAYDILGRQTAATTTIGGTGYGTYTSYDRQSNPTLITYPDGSLLQYLYNNAGLVSSIKEGPSGGSWSNIINNLDYAPTNQPTIIWYANGATTTNTYNANALYRLTGKVSTSLATTTTAIASSSIAYDNSTVGGTGTLVSSLTFSHTTGTGADRAIIVWVDMKYTSSGACSTDTLTGVTYNGTSLADLSYFAGNTSIAGTAVDTFYGYAPASGTNNVVVSASAACIYYAISATYSGVSQTGFPDASGSGNPLAVSATSQTIQDATTTTIANGAWSDFFAIPTVGGQTYTAGPNTNLHQSSSGNYWFADAGPQSPAGNLGVTVISSGNTKFQGNYFSFAPFSSLAGTTTSYSQVQNLAYTYDADGNITQILDTSNTGTNKTMNYTYDDLNRLLTASSTNATTSPNYFDQYTYDALGNLLSSPFGRYSYAGTNNANPDAASAITTGGVSFASIAYDNSTVAGNGSPPVSSLTFSHTTGNGTDRLIVVWIAEKYTTSGACFGDKVTGVTYDSQSLTDLGYYVEDSSTVGAAQKTYYGYAPASGANNVIVSASAACIYYAISATYSGVSQSGFPDASGIGNPLAVSATSQTSADATTTTVANNAWSDFFGIPSVGAQTYTAGANTNLRQSSAGNYWFADAGPQTPAGNLGVTVQSSGSTKYQGNYFSFAPFTTNGGTISTTTLTYDKNGNLLTDGTTTAYTYDYDNRLIQSAVWNGSGTTTTTYGYDYAGNRVSMTVGSTTTLTPTQNYQIVTTGGISTTTKYIEANNNLYATINQTGTSTPTVDYDLTDNLGSPTVVLNASSTIVDTLDYYPYGASRFNTTASGYTGIAKTFEDLYDDPSTNLTYSNARYLNTSQGQFLTEDPIFLGDPREQDLANPQNLNAYSYAEDNPITNEDTNGDAVTSAQNAQLNSIKSQLLSIQSELSSGNLSSSQLGSIQEAIGSANVTVSGITASQPTPSNAFGAEWNPIINTNTNSNLGASGLSAIGVPAVAGSMNNLPAGSWPSGADGDQMIDGILYSDHALLRMAPKGLVYEGDNLGSRGVPPSVVQNAIENGEQAPSYAGRTVYTYQNVTVVTQDVEAGTQAIESNEGETGDIITKVITVITSL